MARRQVPLAPEPIRIVQTAQDMSRDAAMLFMGKPGNMDADDYWMHLYVMISRVRRSAGLLAFDVPALRVFERGPPAWVVEASRSLRRRPLTVWLTSGELVSSWGGILTSLVAKGLF